MLNINLLHALLETGVISRACFARAKCGRRRLLSPASAPPPTSKGGPAQGKSPLQIPLQTEFKHVTAAGTGKRSLYAGLAK